MSSLSLSLSCSFMSRKDETSKPKFLFIKSLHWSFPESVACVSLYCNHTERQTLSIVTLLLSSLYFKHSICSMHYPFLCIIIMTKSDTCVCLLQKVEWANIQILFKISQLSYCNSYRFNSNLCHFLK